MSLNQFACGFRRITYTVGKFGIYFLVKFTDLRVTLTLLLRHEADASKIIFSPDTALYYNMTSYILMPVMVNL